MSDQMEHSDTIRVLHVDDDGDFAELATEFLEREDSRFDTETATSASEGLNCLADSRFDCVISDYEMPGQNGIEFLRTVRREWYSLPFILFTGKGSETVASDAISAGVTDYLQKSSGAEQYELLANRILNAVKKVQAEQQIRTEQERSEALFDRLSQPAVEVRYVDDVPVVRRVNPAFEDVFGYKSETMIGDSLDTHIVPDTRTDEATAINEYAKSGGSLKSREVTRQTADGPRKFLLQSAAYDDRSGMFAIYTDITDRRERRKELEQVETLFQNTQNHLFLIDADEPFTIERLNPAWKDTPGISPEESRGQTIQDVLGEKQAKKVKEKYRTCAEQRENLEYEEQLQFGDENIEWQTRIAPVVIDDEVEYIAGASCNITESKERRQELSKLKQQYQTLAENFPDGAVYLINQNFEYVRARGEALKRADLSPADIEGHSPHDVFPDELADEACNHYEQAFNGETVTAEQEYNGERYRVRVTPVDGDGTEIRCVMAVAQEITEYAENRRELRRRNERLDEFASVVSHDLQNPLSVAEGNLELLREDCESGRIDKIDSALTRMGELIKDLLTLARASEQIGSVESVHLAELSQKCWQNVETTDATIHLNISTTQGITLKADSNRLAQVFENLMRNAIEHARNQADDNVDKSENVTITVGELADGFYVADDGNGIPESEQDDVFEAGYTTTEQGTGFGLSIVEQVVEAHGWEISITESAEGGARFEVTDVDVSRVESNQM